MFRGNGQRSMSFQKTGIAYRPVVTFSSLTAIKSCQGLSETAAEMVQIRNAVRTRRRRNTLNQNWFCVRDVSDKIVEQVLTVCRKRGHILVCEEVLRREERRDPLLARLCDRFRCGVIWASSMDDVRLLRCYLRCSL